MISFKLGMTQKIDRISMAQLNKSKLSIENISKTMINKSLKITKAKLNLELQ